MLALALAICFVLLGLAVTLFLMLYLIPKVERNRTGETLPHLNPASQLPPVDCPLLISVQGQLLRACRPTFAERKGDDLEYELAGGGVIIGRFPWTYP